MAITGKRSPALRRLLSVAAIASGIVAAAVMALALRAPQVIVLAGEGFPGATWPAPGSYALVTGIEVADEPSMGRPPSGATVARFDESGGRALLMERGGVFLVEAYREGTGRDTRLNSYSLVKSLVGALVLKAIADGRIESLDTPLRTVLGADAPDATVGEALTMTSGLVMAPEPPKSAAASLDDAGFSPFGPLSRIHAYGVEAVLADLRVDEGLRGRFHYQSANTSLLGLVLERAYGRPLPELLSEFVWTPAGAANAHWRRTPSGEGVSAYCCLYARPLDWLRVGRFLMDNGTPDAPFLPDAAWRAFVLPALDAEARRQGAYGDHVRHDVLDRPGEALRGPFAYLMGHQGQVVYLLPDQDAVVVRFGERAQLLHSTLYELLPDG